MGRLKYPTADFLVTLQRVLVNIGIEKGEGGTHGFLGKRNKNDLESLIYFIKQKEYYPTFPDKDVANNLIDLNLLKKKFKILIKNSK